MSNPTNRIAYFEITGRDAALTHDFYRALFDWQIVDDPEALYAEVTPGGDVTGGIADIPDDVAPSLTMFVEVDDLAAAIDRAERAGGSLLFPPLTTPNGREIAMIVDPIGVNVGLIRAS
jgi:predicted enzyme related to lactoylglutathione lyase